MSKVKLKLQLCKLLVAEVINGDSVDGVNYENLLNRVVLSEETIFEFEDTQASKIAWHTK